MHLHNRKLFNLQQRRKASHSQQRELTWKTSQVYTSTFYNYIGTAIWSQSHGKSENGITEVEYRMRALEREVENLGKYQPKIQNLSQAEGIHSNDS